MGLFPKKKKDPYGEYAAGIFEEDYTLSDEGIIPVGQRQDINQAPHALTPDEVKGNDSDAIVDDIPMQSAGESLYQRMMSAHATDSEQTPEKAETPKTPEEVTRRSEEVKEQAESLLEKCSQFVHSDKAEEAFMPEPAYTLDSVDDIIAEAEKRAQARVREIYGAKETEAPKAEEKPAEPVKTEPVPEKKPAPVPEIKLPEPKSEPEPAAVPIPPVSPAATVIPSEGITLPKAKTEETDEVKEFTPSSHVGPEQTPEEIVMHREDVRSYHYRFADNDAEGAPESADADEQEPVEEQTIQFTPVKEETPSFSDEIKASLGTDTSFEPEDDEDLYEAEDELYLDYYSYEDAKLVFASLSRKRRMLNIRLVLTVLVAAFSAFMALPFSSAIREISPFGFLIAEVAAVLVGALINLDIFKSFATVLSKRAKADLPLAVSVIFCLGYGIYAIAVRDVNLVQFGIVPLIGMLFSLIGKLHSVGRIIKNFGVVASNDEKFAVSLVDEENGSYAIAHDAVEGEALIAIGKKTLNVTHFMKHSLSPDPFGSAVSVLAGIGVMAASAMLVYGAVTASLNEALGLFIALLCVAAPYSSGAIGSLPLWLASRRLQKHGAMLAGFSDAENIEQTNAVVFDTASLFPRGRVKMYDLKVLSPNDLEQTIFNAAAVTTSANSPLGHVFRRIARTSEEYVLPPADSVKYENRLGISGWVGDHSLLIGNRTLMETHGVAVPSVEVDKKILRSGYFPVYVASDGRPCALLIVRYENDEDITEQLHRLCNMGVTILVDNCDPNVTEEMLCDYFSLPEGFVKVMQSNSVRKYREMCEYSESTESGAAFDGTAKGLASIVAAAIRVRQLTTAMTVIHIICLIIGIAAVAVLFASGMGGYITPITVTLYLLISALLVRACSLFLRP